MNITFTLEEIWDFMEDLTRKEREEGKLASLSEKFDKLEEIQSQLTEIETLKNIINEKDDYIKSILQKSDGLSEDVIDLKNVIKTLQSQLKEQTQTNNNNTI